MQCFTILIQGLGVVELVFIDFWVKFHQLLVTIINVKRIYLSFLHSGGIGEILTLVVTIGQK